MFSSTSIYNGWRWCLVCSSGKTGDDDDDDGDYHYDNNDDDDDDDGDIYIMMKCMCVCLFVTFLLILSSPARLQIFI